MGFLGKQPDPPKPVSDDRKYVFTYTDDINTMAHEILNVEDIMDTHIEVYDIAWQVRYSKRMNQENSDNYRLIMNGSIKVPLALKNQLSKLVDARMKNDINNKRSKKTNR